MKPSLLAPLFKDLSALQGVGKGTLFCLAQLGIQSRFDMISHLPTGLLERRRILTITMAGDGDLVTLPATILSVDGLVSKSRSRSPRPLRIHCQDRSGQLFTIALFRANPDYVARTYIPGQERLISGRVEHFKKQLQISHPDFVGSLEATPYWEGVEPVYPLTKGLTQKRIQGLIKENLKGLPDLPEWHRESVIRQYGWPSWKQALNDVHKPEQEKDLSPIAPTRHRLSFDEMFANQLSMMLVRSQQKQFKGQCHVLNTEMREKFLQILPFSLTKDQNKAIAEIDKDMSSSGRMIRLLQGDVGSGKTVVAMMAMLTAVASGGQAALMAPTEVLARQHGHVLKAWADEMGLILEVLTGSDTAKKKREIYAALASGECHMVVGTHALIQEGLTFRNLTLAIIDEQHRFGVEQRLKLSQKGDTPDLLAMTATPIPRTLMLAAYGDLECSYLREKPANRQDVDTRVISLDRLDEIMDSLQRALQAGDKIYWVCPLIEESETMEIAAAEERYCVLKERLKGFQIGLIHGRLSAQEKIERMSAFRSGDTQILVATTVIEVGVDVQDATVMIIEHAERFGLAQLHQLRGRIGRGDQSGTCLLLYGKESGHLSRQRLQVMKNSHDGFYIAEQDWKLRGGGEVLGSRQSGLQNFRFVDMVVHEPLLNLAHQEAHDILREDPSLKSDRGQAIRILLHLFLKDKAMSYLEAA